MDPTGSGNQILPSCDVVPQPTALLLAHNTTTTTNNNNNKMKQQYIS